MQREVYLCPVCGSDGWILPPGITDPDSVGEDTPLVCGVCGREFTKALIRGTEWTAVPELSPVEQSVLRELEAQMQDFFTTT